jgi:hypothetical protein
VENLAEEVLTAGCQMARKRKTNADRERERAEADRRVWEAFRARLAHLQTFDEASRLVAESPPQAAPGRRYYSNLGFFLHAFIVPAGSGYEERALYLQFIQRLDAAGGLRPGAREKIEADLKRAMEAQGGY